MTAINKLAPHERALGLATVWDVHSIVCSRINGMTLTSHGESPSVTSPGKATHYMVVVSARGLVNGGPRSSKLRRQLGRRSVRDGGDLRFRIFVPALFAVRYKYDDGRALYWASIIANLSNPACRTKK